MQYPTCSLKKWPSVVWDKPVATWNFWQIRNFCAMRQSFRSSRALRRVTSEKSAAAASKGRPGTIRDRFPYWGYGFAAVTVGAAVTIRLALTPALKGHALVVFTLFILISARLCGLAPGLFATALSVLASGYFFTDTSTPNGILHLALFTITGVGIAGLCGDVRRSRIASERSEETTRVLLESAAQAIIAVGADGRIVMANAMAERMFGYTPDELLGSPVELLLTESLRERHVMHRASYAANPRSRPMGSGMDLSARRKDHTEFPVEISLSSVQTAAGPLSVSFIIDITARKQAEEALRESEETLRAVLESAAQAIIGVDSQGRMSLVNVMAERMFGYSRAELMGEPVEMLLPEDLRKQHREHRALYSSNPHIRPMGIGMDLTARSRDGSQFPVEVSLSTLQTPRGQLFVSFVTDISERKQYEEALRQKNVRLQELTRALDLAPALIMTPEKVIIYWSQGASNLYGWSPEEAIGRPIHDLLKTEFSEPLAKIEQSMARNGFWEGELRQIHKEGKALVVASHWALLRDEHGQPAAIVEVNTDITESKLAAEALRQANLDRQRYLAQFEAVVDHLTDGLILSDLRGNIFYLNPAALAIHEFASMEEGTRPFSEFASTFELLTAEGETLGLEQWPPARILCGETLRNWEVNVRRRHSNWERIFSYGGTLVRNQQGSPLLAIITVKDITASKRAAEALREREADLKRAQAVSHTGSWRRHFGRNRLEWSDETCRIFGIRVETSLNYEVFLSAVHPEDRDFVEKSVEAWCLGNSDDIEHRIIAEGKVKWVRERAELEFDERGTPVAVFGTIQDITDRKHAEEEIRQLNAQLEQRVRDRTTQLEASNRELEAFSYSVSDDSRAPLCGIDGWSLALLEDFGDQIDRGAREYLDRVRSETQRMGMLIDDLLKLSSITRVQMQSDPVDLTALGLDISARLREAHPDRQIEFIIQPGLTTFGDARLLDIALTNLLGNAVKFTAPRSLGRIEFGQLEQNGSAVFFIRDNGVGFDMAYAKTLFGAFQRLHKSSQFPGTGIGLATVQRVIRRHGGQLWADAQPDQGATFYFCM